jgi:16S rRNA (guanine527-N7)-methyltransferase
VADSDGEGVPDALGLEPATRAGIAALAARYGLGAEAERQLGRLLELLVRDPLAPTAIRSERAALENHLADSLVALECEAVASARSVVDLGAGAGVPGLPLAIADPPASFTLLESSSRKARFMERAVERCGVANAKVVHARAESFQAGRGGYDLVTVRAVGALPVVAEYAAPLLRIGGTLLAWHGRREPDAEAALGVAADVLGFGAPSIRSVQPYRGSEHRHLYALPKLRETPPRFPRRPGMALKRPLGAEIARDQASSDRIQR